MRKISCFTGETNYRLKSKKFLFKQYKKVMIATVIFMDAISILVFIRAIFAKHKLRAKILLFSFFALYLFI